MALDFKMRAAGERQEESEALSTVPASGAEAPSGIEALKLLQDVAGCLKGQAETLRTHASLLREQAKDKRFSETHRKLNEAERVEFRAKQFDKQAADLLALCEWLKNDWRS